MNVTSETLLKVEYEHDLYSNSADSPNTAFVFIFVNIINLSGFVWKAFLYKTIKLNALSQIKQATYL